MSVSPTPTSSGKNDDCSDGQAGSADRQAALLDALTQPRREGPKQTPAATLGRSQHSNRAQKPGARYSRGRWGVTAHPPLPGCNKAQGTEAKEGRREDLYLDAPGEREEQGKVTPRHGALLSFPCN